MHQKNAALEPHFVTFTLNGQTVVAPADQTLLQIADGQRRGSASPLLHGGHARRRQLPHVHGRDRR